MARRYYFKAAGGRKTYCASLDAATAGANRLARKLGRGVAVGYDDVKDQWTLSAKSAAGRRVSEAFTSKSAALDAAEVYSRKGYSIAGLKRNPDPAAFFDMMRQRTLEADKARAVGQRRRAKQLKPAKRQAPATPAKKQAPGKQGAAARRAGMPSAMNPYKPGSMGAHLWRNGWEKAR